MLIAQIIGDVLLFLILLCQFDGAPPGSTPWG
jgi:hypothetical protein